MPLPSVSGAYRTISEFSNVAAGKPWTVTFDFLERSQDNGLASELAAAMVVDVWPNIASTLIGAGPANIGDRFCDEVELNQVTVYPLGSNAAPSIVTGPVPFGDSSATPLAPDLAVVISKRTNFRGRSGRGRAYMGGLADGVTDPSGFLQGPFVVSLNNAFTNEMKVIVTTSGTFDACIITPQAPPPSGPWVPLARLVTEFTVDNHFDVQRRRGVR